VVEKQPAARIPAAGQPRIWSSHRHGAATDTKQPRTWTLQGGQLSIGIRITEMCRSTLYINKRIKNKEQTLV
jgi:hypothetical protein